MASSIPPLQQPTPNRDSPSLKSRFFFVVVRDTQAKLSAVCALSRKHFLKRERLLITVADEASAHYIDQLLWRFPEESFLPHAVVQQESQEAIAITYLPRNWNQASFLLNLSPQPTPLATHFPLIYELLDKTHPAKEALAKKKWETYQSAGYSVGLCPN